MNKYRRLTSDERGIIGHLYNSQRKTPTQIAEELGRSRATIYRELRNNKDSSGMYEVEKAQNSSYFHRTNSHKKSLLAYEKFIVYLENNFNRLCFGVDVCVAQSRKTKKKTPCTKTVYNWIKNDLLTIKPKDLLRKRKKWTWNKPKKNSQIKTILNHNGGIPIAFRPDSINNRLSYGHWEMDLVMGCRGSRQHILTMVERKTRIIYARFVRSKRPEDVVDGLVGIIKENTLEAKSITRDNGLEFQRVKEAVEPLGTRLYRCHPYASFERGTNENANGLLRRWFPKGTDFSELTDWSLQQVVEQINNMPRKMFGYKTAMQQLPVR